MGVVFRDIKVYRMISQIEVGIDKGSFLIEKVGRDVNCKIRFGEVIKSWREEGLEKKICIW